jgi:RNA polymerase sigma-70 factor (ECF subfamily)
MTLSSDVMAGPASRLAQISTVRGLTPQDLIERYGKAIRSYLIAFLGDEQDANDVARIMQIKILRGQFSSWQPEFGRFRDFLKASVRNAAKDFLRKKQRERKAQTNQANLLSHTADPHSPNGRIHRGGSDEFWLAVWREAILDRCLHRMRKFQASTRDNISYDIIRILANEPELCSDELASRLTQLTRRPISAVNARKCKQRAQEKLAEFIIDEVSETLATPCEQDLRDELQTAGLLQYVGSYLSDALSRPRHGICESPGNDSARFGSNGQVSGAEE